MLTSTDLPDGCTLRKPVKPRARRYSVLQNFGFDVYVDHPASLLRDVSRSSRHVGRGCSGREGAARRAATVHGRRNRVVLTPQSSGVKQPAMRKRIAGCDGGKREGSPRRARISRKPLRREGRCDHRLYLWFLRLREFSLRKAPGAAATRPSLCPLTFKRVVIMQDSGATRRGNKSSCARLLHCERSDAIQGHACDTGLLLLTRKCASADAVLAMTACAV